MRDVARFYAYPERAGDIATIKSHLLALFENTDLCEIGCGYGFWTNMLKDAARSIVAIDNDIIAIEKARVNCSTPNVTFLNADVLTIKDQNFDFIFLSLFLSSLKIQVLDKYISAIKHLCNRSAKVVILENNYVQGSSFPIVYKDRVGNTYNTGDSNPEHGRLNLKNYYTTDFIDELFHSVFKTSRILSLQYYWMREFELL